MADDLQMNVDYKCFDGEKEGRTNIQIPTWRSKQVKDLKLAIQDELKVPCCDQRLFYRDQILADDSFPLSNLYLRENDLLRVEFLAAGDLNGMDELISNLKDFAEAITDDPAKHEQILKIKFNLEGGSTDLSFSMSKYDLVLRALENLAFVYFIPWKNPSSVVQRHYFVQQGGFDAFLTVFTFSHKRFKVETVNKPKGNCFRKKETGSEEISRELAHYNNEQQMLEMHCLSLLWNFSETSHDRKHAMSLGSLEKVMDAMLLDPHVMLPEDDGFWVIISLIETAVGCLVQYAEFSGTQEIIAKSQETVSRLMTMVECRLHRDTTFYSLYSSQIAANTLFCCACSTRSPVVLVENGVHNRMIKLTRHLLDNDHDMALRYYCCLFLARLKCCPAISLGHQTTRDIDSLLDKFTVEYKPQEISQWEEAHNYVWVTMVPFVGIAFAGGSNTRLNLQLNPTEGGTGYSEDIKTPCHSGNVSSMLEYSGKEASDGDFIRHEAGVNTGDYVKHEVFQEAAEQEESNAGINSEMGEGCQGDCMTSQVAAEQEENNSGIDSENDEECIGDCIPSQGVAKQVKHHGKIAAFSSLRLPGSLATQNIGLFCLQHLMSSSENRALVTKERLVPYLVCLRWHLYDRERKSIDVVLRGFPCQEPPSLAVIAKTVMALMKGFEIALNM